MSIENGKVSIVSACYNGETYIKRFLNAILVQTYSPIQLIITDDGSTDNTLEILKSYKDIFIDKKIEYHILRQENGGQASAINKGLKLADGEFITWPDTDDFLFQNSIERRVEYLNLHRDCDMVLSNGNEYEEGDLNLVHEKVVHEWQASSLFDCVLKMTAMFNNNGYLVKSKNLWLAYPDRNIYETRAGQNIQLLLPLASFCKCGYIDEPLYGRIIRTNSHSKQQKNIVIRDAQISDAMYHTISILKKNRSYAAARYAIENLYTMGIYYQDHDKEKAKQNTKQVNKLIRVLVMNKIKYMLHSIIKIKRDGGYDESK